MESCVASPRRQLNFGDRNCPCRFKTNLCRHRKRRLLSELGRWRDMEPYLAGATLPGHTITRIDSAAKLGADFLLVTIGNFGHSHLFCSRDGGKTWEDVDNGQLPDVPHHAVVIRPDEPKTVYVGNDAGVFVSHDTGITWMNMTRNLPNVMIVDLVLHEKDGTLSAATYGRSLWRTRI